MNKYPTFEEWSPPKPDGSQQRSVWGFGGYYENMIETALRNDDPDGFVHFMRMAGLDNTSMTFDNKTMEQYCDKNKSVKCKKALGMLRAQKEIRELSAQLRA